MDGFRRKARRCAVVLGTSVMVAAYVGAPAHAAERVLTDPDDALGADIRRARVVNDDQGLRVRVRMDRIVKDGSSRAQALSLFIDTDDEDAGPEYVLATGLNRGTDWTLRRVSTWGSEGRVVRCKHAVHINWTTDRVRLVLDRGCLGGAGSVRVALKAAEWTPAHGTRVDWWSGRRLFSPPVALD